METLPIRTGQPLDDGGYRCRTPGSHVGEHRATGVRQGDEHGTAVTGVDDPIHPTAPLETLHLARHGGLAAVVGSGEVTEADGAELLDLREQPGLGRRNGEICVAGRPAVEPRDDAENLATKLHVRLGRSHGWSWSSSSSSARAKSGPMMHAVAKAAAISVTR